MTAEEDRRAGVTITNREIYDQVLATKDLTAKLVDKIDVVEKRDTDHEARIRSLEQWRWTMTGITAVISWGGAAIVAAITGG
ncbi:hypothetical protein ABZU76_03005 [Amycolatopsis sp. NPDC005232]|uniref:hypothetical protein n=1 Tax=Amycolatopsis sp. NPDC005232 TaxID=3157027 RepID=UPI0033A261DC